MHLALDRILDRSDARSRLARVPSRPQSSVWPALAIAGPVYDVDMSCADVQHRRNVNIAGRSFTCKAVALFHTQRGRSGFCRRPRAVPADNSHIISFSGESVGKTEERSVRACGRPHAAEVEGSPAG